MKTYMNLNKIIIVSLLLLSFQSCTKDIDFNQIDDASIHTTYIVTLIHLNLKASNFLNELNQEITFTQDLIQASIQTETRSYLEKIEFTVLSNNTFDRDFTLNVIFYNEFNEPIYTLQPHIFIQENSSEITTIIEIPEEDIAIIYNTNYFGFTLVLSESTDGSVLSINEASTLQIQSFVKLFVNYKKI